MTRQEHVAIGCVTGEVGCARLTSAARFAAMLAKDDPRTDRDRFLAAALSEIERRDAALASPITELERGERRGKRSDRGASTLTMRPVVSLRVAADLIRKLLAGVIDRLAEPRRATQRARITYLRGRGPDDV